MLPNSAAVREQVQPHGGEPERGAPRDCEGEAERFGVSEGRPP
jgi:hypothetical protein